VFGSMSALVTDGRLMYPKQVVDELERAADLHSPDSQYLWAKQNEAKAIDQAPSLEEVKKVLASVPTVLDPDKDTGAEEADP
jgi:SpoU rRNA methylase family enzyme